MDKANNEKLLQAQIGNLEVQIADYQQIVQELTEKLLQYESKHGSVFKKGAEDKK
jgi:hypothetical protein